jgi:hypothetical protein
MKKIITLFFVGASIGAFGQTIVGTAVETKVAVLEEFTGVNCPNCPGGHTEAASILSNNPGQVVLMAYHPSNSSYTTPGTGEPDFRRNYLDAFYTTAYLGSRYMPGAMVNRRTWAGEKISGASTWSGHTQTIIAETSPANIGVSSVFNETTNELTVNVEVYYTSDVTNTNSIYVHLTEDDLVAYQSGNGGSANYSHQHMFRENLNSATWGDPVTGTTTTGSLFTKTYVYDMTTATSPVDMSKAHVVAFIYDGTAEEVYTGTTSSVIVSQAGISELDAFLSTNLYPNPTNGTTILSVDSKEQQAISIQVIDAVGKIVYQEDREVSAGEVLIPLNSNETLKKGVYFVNVSKGNATKTLKLMVK